MPRPDDALWTAEIDRTVFVEGPIGRRAWSFAHHVGEAMRVIGFENVRRISDRAPMDLTRIVFRKPRHARNMVQLQARDVTEGVL